MGIFQTALLGFLLGRFAFGTLQFQQPCFGLLGAEFINALAEKSFVQVITAALWDSIWLRSKVAAEPPLGRV